MKILNLNMEAFGPFKKSTTIDFDKFDGIFLINGATGSGKTTIFDSIVFALYGESSSGDRTESMLRNTRAKVGEATKVRLVFEYKNTRYEIERTTEYEKIGRGGNITTNNTKNASIKFGDEVISGTSAVNKYITSLFGINKEQFSQIVILAQGKFKELLISNSEDKIALFRTIFSTEKFNRLDEEISRKLSEFNKLYTIENTKLNEIISTVQLDDEQIDSFNQLRTLGHSSILSFLKSEIKENEKKLKKLEKEEKKLSKLKEEIGLKINNAEKYFKNEEELIFYEKNFDEISKNYSEVLIKRENTEILNNEITRYNLEINKLENEIEKFSRLISLKKEVEDLTLDFEKINQESDLYKSEIENLKLQQNEIKNFLLENKNIEIDIEKNLSKKSDLLRKSDEIEKLLQNEKELELLSSEIIKISNEYNEILEKVNFEKKLFEKIEREYFASEHAQIASKIGDGDACPVCGSKEHPNLAKYDGQIRSFEEVKKLSKSYQSLEKKKTQLSNTRLLKQELFEEKKTEFSNSIVRFENGDLFLANELNKKELEENKAIYSNLLEIRNRKFELEKNSEEIELKLTKLVDNDRTLSVKKAKLEEAITRLEKEILSEESKLKNKNLEKIKSKRKEYQNLVNTNADEIKKIGDEFDSISAKYYELRSKIETIKASMKDEDKHDINLLTQEKSKNESLIKEALDKILKSNSRIQNYTNSVERISEIGKNIEQYSKLISDYTDLNNVLSGKIAKSGKVKFETFIQMRYFDEVLHYANIRLRDMTGNKYSLKRKTTKAGNSQIGLDIEVVDHNNRSIRDVKSLSGGETFQASLALALGLSDVVQMNSGGIQLDSMFIDEGFGSLDEETLSTLMNSLAKISNHNKTIGIISHVAKLKEQIDKQIIVTKNNMGESEISKLIY